MNLNNLVYNATLSLRNYLDTLVDSRWDNHPFGTKPLASRKEYLTLFESARNEKYPLITGLEQKLGYAINRDWLDDLALHTQIVIKKSKLAYPHGRLLYSLLRWMIAVRNLNHVTVLETGTARGFSALCMAKAISDADVDGRIVSVDVLPHLKRQIWNCIDDHDGPKSRAEILAPWHDLIKNIIFIQGDTLKLLPRIGLEKVHFAYLDAQHTETNVMQEYSSVSPVQSQGDIIVFDDVTQHVFPGVVAAVENIAAKGEYTINKLSISDQRCYAWGIKL